MVLKIFKGVWFLSVLAVLANLLYVYATLPQEVMLQQDDEMLVIGRDMLFYVLMAFLALVNALVYVFSKSMTPSEDFRSWLTGLITILNVFVIIAVSFIGLLNSSERYDFGRVGGIIYASVILIAVWAVGWPVYLLMKKMFSKS